MWRVLVCGLGLMAACAMTRSVERRQLADGSWQVKCRLPMDACVREFESVCPDGRYRILGGVSRRDVRDVAPVVREYRTSELSVICSSAAAELPVETAAPSFLPPPPDAGSTPMVARGPLCVAGASQACVGPGGCSGGQACRPDGSGFGPCDCGPAKIGGDAGP
jgi:hypothetical protein